MSFQSLNPELTAKVIFLANLQRNLMQNPNVTKEKTLEEHQTLPTTTVQQCTHPLLMPSLNVSSQKISAMLAALTPSSVLNGTTSTNTAQFTSLPTSNNNSVHPRTTNSSVNIRSNGSSFGWGNRERKMEENWRMQNRDI